MNEPEIRPGRVAVPTVLYYGSRLASQAGQGAFFAFLVVIAGPGSQGALGLGSVMVAMTAAAITLGPFGGSIVDRLGPRFALPVGAVLRLVAITSAVAILGHGEYAWVVAFVYSAASQVFSPAELALVSLLRRRRPAGAHASLFALQFGGQLFGAFALAPLMFWLGGTAAMLIASVAVYAIVVALASVLGVRMRAASEDSSAPGGLRPTNTPAGVERASGGFRSTLRFIGGEPQALYAVALLAFIDVMTKCLMVAAPIYLRSELHLAGSQMILLVATAGAGALIGMFWAARRLKPADSPMAMRMVLLATLLSIFALTPLGDGLTTLTITGSALEFRGFAEPLLIGSLAAIPAVLVLGMALSMAPIVARSVLTATAPVGQQGRVFAAEAVLSNVLVIPALLLAALSTDLVSARVTVMFVGVIGGVVFLLLEYRALSRGVGRVAAIDPIPEVAPDLV